MKKLIRLLFKFYYKKEIENLNAMQQRSELYACGSGIRITLINLDLWESR